MIGDSVSKRYIYNSDAKDKMKIANIWEAVNGRAKRSEIRDSGFMWNTYAVHLSS